MMTSQLRRLLSLLDNGLGYSKTEEFSEHEDMLLWKIAREHKVATILSRAFIGQNLSEEFENESLGIWQMCAIREQAYLREAGRLKNVLQENGIALGCLKGLFLSDQCYPAQAFVCTETWTS